MNRRKKGNQILKARIKKAKAKLAPKSKAKYISKADRAKLEADSVQSDDTPSDTSKDSGLIGSAHEENR